MSLPCRNYGFARIWTTVALFLFLLSTIHASPDVCSKYPSAFRSTCLDRYGQHKQIHTDSSISPLELNDATIHKLQVYLSEESRSHSKRVASVVKRLQRALAANSPSAAVAVHRAAVAVRTSPLFVLENVPSAHSAIVARWKLAAQDADYKVSSKALRTDMTELDTFATHSIVQTISGLLSCYGDEEDPSENSVTSCDIQALLRFSQLVDVLIAWHDARFAKDTLPLTEWLHSLQNLDDQNAARAVILDVFGSTMVHFLTVSMGDSDESTKQVVGNFAAGLNQLPAAFGSDPVSESAQRGVAEQAINSVRLLGQAIRSAKRKSPMWYGLLQAGGEWVLGPIAKLFLDPQTQDSSKDDL